MTIVMLCLLTAYTSLWSQEACVQIESIDVLDNETRVISFTVSGVALDDLSDPNQGIDSIQLEFDHESVTDLEISLFTPANQSITLVGPIVGSNVANDGILGWDITFLPCSEMVEPDPRIDDDNFSNLSDWVNFEFYNGSYYPFNGCFEDLNAGSVNGKWTLVVRDGNRFDDGLIESIKIVFKEADGLEFSVCEAFAGEIVGGGDIDDPIPVCDFKDDLIIVNFTIPVFRVPDEEYNYEFVISDLRTEDVIAIQQDFPDLRDTDQFPLGDYQICGLSYNVDDSIAVFDQLENGNLSDFRDFVSSVPAPVCADLMEQCLIISKLPIANEVELDTTICNGGEFELIDGTGLVQRFTSEFQDTVKIGAAACDSVIILNVQQMDLEAIISSDTDMTLNCPTDTITLGASMSQIVGPPERLWTTQDGEIIGDSTSFQIRVAQPGSYTLSILSEQGCIDSTTLVIGQNFDTPDLDLFADGTITCENAAVNLTATSSEGLFNAIWTGPDFSGDGLDVTVFDDGLYTFTADLANGCTVEDTLRIITDISIPDFDIELELVDCRAQIQFLNNSIPAGASWISPSGEVFNEATPIVTEQGIYDLIAESNNGCIDTVDVTIDFEPPLDTIQIIGGSLTCIDTSTVIGLTDVSSFQLISWAGPDNFFQIEDSIEVSVPGIYTVRTQDVDNCPGIGEFEVLSEMDMPVIEIDGANLPCTGTETVLMASTASTADIEWEGPNFQFTGAMATVSEVGMYVASVLGNNGCVGMDTFFVRREEPFEVSVIDTVLNCDFSPIFVEARVSIQPDQVEWSGPNGFSSSNLSIPIDQTGDYFLTVTNDQCSVLDTLRVGLREAEISFDAVGDFQLNCEMDSVQLMLDVIGPVQTIIWTTEDFDILFEDAPFVSEPGMYQIEASDQFNCAIDTSILVSLDTMPPVVSIDRSGSFACDQTEVDLTANIEMVGSPIILWFGDDNMPLPDRDNPMQNITEPGTFTVRVFNPSNGCVAEEEVTLIEEENTFEDLELTLTSPCEDQQTGIVNVSFIGGDAPFEISLDNDVFVEADQIGSLPAGPYQLFARDANGCTFMEDFVLESVETPTLDVPDSLMVAFNDQVELGIDTFGLGLNNIEWGLNNNIFATGTDSISFQAEMDARIQLFIQTQAGCLTSTEINVFVELPSSAIHIPNAFRPGSEQNGLFQFGVNRNVTTVLELNIFDRWGNLVYSVANAPADSDYGWDGTFNREMAEQGVYVFWGRLQSIDGEIEEVEGTLQLFR